MKILVSACLLGQACRYDGKSKANAAVCALAEKHALVPFCPEIYGGLPTPRTPAERRGDRVVTADSRDVTENYQKGAEAALKLARQLGCECAILKERSPSCGKGRIYDGTFSGTLTGGDGVTAALFRSAGIPVYGESEVGRATRLKLALIAEENARLPFHGFIEGQDSNLDPIIGSFPKWTLREADGLWCAAFVYHCCQEAGFDFPIRPRGCVTCHLAGCVAWEEFAVSDSQLEHHKGTEAFGPEAGDIVIYDRVFNGQEHDHMGIVLRKRGKTLVVAEGNIENRSGIVERPLDAHIRGFVRIPDGYRYKER